MRTVDADPGGTCSTFALRFAPYWVGRQRHLAHQVKEIQIVWRGGSTSWARPRLVVQTWCGMPRSVHDGSAGLEMRPNGVRLCDRCTGNRLINRGFVGADEPLDLP